MNDNRLKKGGPGRRMMVKAEKRVLENDRPDHPTSSEDDIGRSRAPIVFGVGGIQLCA